MLMETCRHFVQNVTPSFYAVENWTFVVSNKALRIRSIAQHKVVLRICGLTPQKTNYDASLTVRVNTFRHLYAKQRVGFVFAVWNSESPCLASLRYYLRYRSVFCRQIVEYFRAVYEFPDLFHNPFYEIRARVDFFNRMNRRLVLCVRYFVTACLLLFM